jgi:hypothetical protein
MKKDIPPFFWGGWVSNNYSLFSLAYSVLHAVEWKFPIDGVDRLVVRIYENYLH